MNKKRLTRGNIKVKAWMFSLPPIKSCLNCSSCASACYATKSYRQYPSVKALWNSNFNLVKQDMFKLYDDLDRQLNSISKRSKLKIVRIHQSGDFYNQTYVNMWYDLVSKYPNITFYGYTKVDKLLDISKLNSLTNCNIITSYVNDKLNFGTIDYVSELVKESNAIICPATYGDNKGDVKCGLTCFHCMNKDSSVAFVQH